MNVLTVYETGDDVIKKGKFECLACGREVECEVYQAVGGHWRSAIRCDCGYQNEVESGSIDGISAMLKSPPLFAWETLFEGYIPIGKSAIWAGRGRSKGKKIEGSIVGVVAPWHSAIGVLRSIKPDATKTSARFKNRTRYPRFLTEVKSGERTIYKTPSVKSTIWHFWEGRDDDKNGK